MADMKLRTLPPGHIMLLRGALNEAVESLSEIERTPAVKACLADNLLALAASGEVEAAQLSEVALVRVRESCLSCRGCQGISTLVERRSSSFQADLGSEQTISYQ